MVNKCLSDYTVVYYVQMMTKIETNFTLGPQIIQLIIARPKGQHLYVTFHHYIEADNVLKTAVMNHKVKVVK